MLHIRVLLSLVVAVRYQNLRNYLWEPPLEGLTKFFQYSKINMNMLEAKEKEEMYE